MLRWKETLAEAQNFFSDHEIDLAMNPERTLSIFVDSFHDYNYRLRRSINLSRKAQGGGFKWNPSYYTYIILDGEKVLNLIGKLRGPFYRILGIKNSDFAVFKSCIKYGGKGTAWRDNWHLHDVKIRMEGFKFINKDDVKKVGPH